MALIGASVWRSLKQVCLHWGCSYCKCFGLSFANIWACFLKCFIIEKVYFIVVVGVIKCKKKCCQTNRISCRCSPVVFPWPAEPGGQSWVAGLVVTTLSTREGSTNNFPIFTLGFFLAMVNPIEYHNAEPWVCETDQSVAEIQAWNVCVSSTYS